MDVYINNTPLPLDGAATVGALLDRLRSDDPDRLITAVVLDGAPVGDDELKALLAAPLDGAGRLDLQAESTRSLAAQALGQAANLLEQTYDRYERISERIAVGETAEAMNLLNDCFSIWNTAEQSLAQAARAGAVDLAAPIHDGRPPAARIEALQDRLNRIRQSLQIRDYVAVGDLAAHEMPQLTEDWQGALVACQQALLAR